MMHFSEGPDFYSSDKALDKLKNDAAKVFSINDWKNLVALAAPGRTTTTRSSSLASHSG